MQQRHVLDLKRAQVAGRQLFAANDPKPTAEVKVDPKCDAADRRALELQLRQQHVADVTGRPL
jgi:hypothetical protein